MNRTTIALFFVCLTLALLAYLTYEQLVGRTVLSEQEIQSRVATLYNGNVTHVQKEDDYYYVTFETASATYEVDVQKTYGTFSHLTQLTGSNVLPPTLPTNEKLTKSAIIDIAKKEANGEIDDIDFHPTSDGGYYMVEVDQSNDRSVELQIHAVTGKILSVSFDD